VRAHSRTLFPAASALAEGVLAEINKLPTDTEMKRDTGIKMDALTGASYA